MKKNILIIMVLCIFVFSPFLSINAQWARTYGLNSDDFAYSIQETSDGGYIVVGGTMSFGAGDIDSWILKLSSIGEIEWQQTYGGSNEDRTRSIEQTSDGGYIVAGYTNSYGAGLNDAWVLKLNSIGEIEWQQAYGGSDNDIAHSIQETSDGGYIVVGSTMSFGAGDVDSWILKLSSIGEIEWQQTYGENGHDETYYIQQTTDGGYIVAGFTLSFGVGGEDSLILKLSTDGDVDPLCGIIGSSDASILSTSVSPEGTNITPQDTDITPLPITVTGQDTDATIYQLCPAQNYTLTISAATGGTTEPPPGNYTYTPATWLTVTALYDDGYIFKEWTGDVPSGHENDNPMAIMMGTDKSITANFNDVEEELCFIATAAYGSPLHPYVKILRDFRDKYLVSNKLGREFVDLYYKYSLFVANIIARNKPLKVVVRIHLAPIIIFSYSIIHLGPIITGGILLFILVLSVFLMSVLRRK